MHKLSTGHDSTLGTYLMLSKLAFGEESKATEFIRQKIKNSINGENAEVIADESQMLILLKSLNNLP